MKKEKITISARAIKNNLRLLVKNYYDYQAMRVRMDNRIQLKKDGTEMKDHPKNDKAFIVEKDDKNYMVLKESAEQAKMQEDMLENYIAKLVKSTDLWQNFLVNVKGCGPLMAAVIIAEIDIEKAAMVSQIWSYAGISPGTTCGRKWNKDKTEIIKTETLIPQDRLSPGFLSPYNQWLRTKLLGVLAASMVKSQSEYAINYYYSLHTPKARKAELGEGRLDIEENIYVKTGKMWKDESEGHRNNAAKRYMIKMFLKDLYVAWRTLEGLPVREPYQEEYLGHKHHVA